MSLTDEQKQKMIAEYIANPPEPQPEAPFARVGPFGGIRWNYGRIARELFVVEQLPVGALPIYDRELDVTATVLGEDHE